MRERQLPQGNNAFLHPGNFIRFIGERRWGFGVRSRLFACFQMIWQFLSLAVSVLKHPLIGILILLSSSPSPRSQVDLELEHIAQGNFAFLVVPPSPERWNYRYVPSCLTFTGFLSRR